MANERPVAFGGMTSVDPALAPTPATGEEIIAACKRLMNEPRLIGELYGCPVYVDPTDRKVILERMPPDGRPLRVSLDHPYLAGTKIEKAARAALQESSDV